MKCDSIGTGNFSLSKRKSFFNWAVKVMKSYVESIEKLQRANFFCESTSNAAGVSSYFLFFLAIPHLFFFNSYSWMLYSNKLEVDKTFLFSFFFFFIFSSSPNFWCTFYPEGVKFFFFYSLIFFFFFHFFKDIESKSIKKLWTRLRILFIRNFLLWILENWSSQKENVRRKKQKKLEKIFHLFYGNVADLTKYSNWEM